MTAPCKYVLSRAGLYDRKVVQTEYELRDHKIVIVIMPAKIRAMMAQGWKLERYEFWVSGASGGKAAKKSPKGHKPQPQQDKGSKLAPKKYPSTPEWYGDAQKCADIIARIVGDGVKSREKGRYNVDVVGLAGSWAKGENPINFLSRPVEAVRKPVLMISPDCSGSCARFSAFTKGFAHILAKHYEVYYEENVNGWVGFCPDEVDLILYMGDQDFFSAGTDGEYTTGMEADGRTALCWVKTRVIGFDNYASNFGKIGIGKGLSEANRAWIMHVGLKDPKQYIAALEAAAKYFTR